MTIGFALYTGQLNVPGVFKLRVFCVVGFMTFSWEQRKPEKFCESVCKAAT